MPEINIRIVALFDDQDMVARLQPLFAWDGEEPERNAYRVISSVAFEDVFIGIVRGEETFDEESFIGKVRAMQPDWLLVDSYDFDQSTLRCWKDDEEAGEEAVRKAVRSSSPQADLYFALHYDQNFRRVSRLLSSGSIDLNMIYDRKPLLHHLMMMGAAKSLEHALKLGADVQVRYLASDPLCYDIVPGMNLLSVAVQRYLQQSISTGIENPEYHTKLINAGIDINAADERGRTPLTLALDNFASKAFVERLLEAGADLHHEPLDGRVPLFRVLENYQGVEAIRLAERMMELGADIRHVSKNKVNAAWAARGQAKKIVEFVKSHGVTDYMVPDGEYPERKGMWRNVIHSIVKDDLESLRGFFDPSEMNDNEKFDVGRWAIGKGKEDFLRFMIENGISPNVRSIYNETLLGAARSAKKSKILKYLEKQLERNCQN